MVGVFAIFATSRIVGLQQFGLGLGVAVLIDATIIRVVLLPATMKILGGANWYLPSWLDWLPRVSADERGRTTTRPAAQYADGGRLNVQLILIECTVFGRGPDSSGPWRWDNHREIALTFMSKSL